MHQTSHRFLAATALSAWLGFAQVYFAVVQAYGVADAQEANDFGAALLSGANSLPAANSTVPTGSTGAGTFNVREYVPGASETKAWSMSNYYNNPAALKDAVTETQLDSQETGCRATHFSWEKSNHPVMKVEYVRLVTVHDRSPTTGAFLYDASGAPLTTMVVAERNAFPSEDIAFRLKVFGSDDQYLDVQTYPSLGVDGYAYRFTYDRMEEPSDGSFAPTYARVSAGALNFTSYGTAQNQWEIVGTINAPGQWEVILYSNLVSVETTYWTPAGPCPADPPGCTVDGVDICSTWGYYVGSIFTQSDYQAQARSIVSVGDVNFSGNRAGIGDVTAAVSVSATNISNGTNPLYNEVHGGGCNTDRRYTNTGVNGSVYYNSQQCQSDYMGCLGTDCHNPSAEYNGGFNQAVVGLSAIDQIQHDITCTQTGEAPTDVWQSCDVRIFKGDHQTCKVPIGSGAGLTPDCCDEGRNAASGIDVFNYFKLLYYGQKLMRMNVVQGAMANWPGVAGWKSAYQGVTNTVQSAIQATTKTFENAASGFMQELGFDNAVGGTTTPSFNLNILSTIQQKLMQVFYEFLKRVFGEQFANTVIVQTAGGAGGTQTLAFAGPIAWIIAIYYIYQIIKIIGHLVFKCTEDELKLGIGIAAEQCIYAGKYCHDEILGICVEKRKSWCCYKSYLSRLFMQELRVNQNLGGGLYEGGARDAENPYCDGLTTGELQAADWSRIDLTPYIQRLKVGGILPTTTY